MSTNKDIYTSGRRRKSFIACLGLSPRVSSSVGVDAQRSARPVLPRPRYDGKLPVPSSPRLLAAFGQSNGFGPGQHPSHYPMEIVSAMAAAGVELSFLPVFDTEDVKKDHEDDRRTTKEEAHQALEGIGCAMLSKQQRRHSIDVPLITVCTAKEPDPPLDKINKRLSSALYTTLPYRRTPTTTTTGNSRSGAFTPHPNVVPYPSKRSPDEQATFKTSCQRAPDRSQAIKPVRRGSPPPQRRRKCRMPPSPAYVPEKLDLASRVQGGSSVDPATTISETNLKPKMETNKCTSRRRSTQSGINGNETLRRNSDYAAYAVYQCPRREYNTVHANDQCSLPTDETAQGETRLDKVIETRVNPALDQSKFENRFGERAGSPKAACTDVALVRTGKSAADAEQTNKCLVRPFSGKRAAERSTASVAGDVKHLRISVKKETFVAQPHAEIILDSGSAANSGDETTVQADEDVFVMVRQVNRTRTTLKHGRQRTRQAGKEDEETDAVLGWIEDQSTLQLDKQTNRTPQQSVYTSDKRLNDSFEHRTWCDSHTSKRGLGTGAEQERFVDRSDNIDNILVVAAQDNNHSLQLSPSPSIASTLFTALASLPSQASVASSSSLSNMPGSFSPLVTVLHQDDSVKVGESSSSVFESAFGGDYNGGYDSDSDASSLASSAVIEEATISPRAHMTLHKQARLRASQMLNMQSSQRLAQQLSMFDDMEQSNEHKDDVRAVQRERRRMVSRSSSSSSSLASSKSSSSTTSQLSINTPPSCTSDLAGPAHPFVSELGCWMEEADVSTVSNNEQDSSLVRSMAGVSLSSPTSPTSTTRKAPPRPVRHTSRARQGTAAAAAAITDDSASVASSWSSLRRVPMYTRLGHLPLRLVEPPSSMSWRSRIGKLEFERLSQEFEAREMRRQEVIEEFYVTESNFITSITGILRTFSEPLRFSDNAFHGDVPMEVARLFHDLDEILAVHVKMFQALDTIIKAHPTALVVSMAGSISPIVQELAVYQPYLIRYESVIKLWDGLRVAENKGDLAWFVETMERQEMLPECMGLTLASFLLKPVQRLMKYPLFFKQLDELVDADHPDSSATTALNKSMEQLIRNMNTVKAREEDFELLQQLERNIKGLPEGFTLASRQRRLVKQGAMRCVRLSDAQRSTLAERSRWALPSPVARAPSPLLRTLSPSQQQSEAVRELRRSSLTNTGSSLEVSPRTSSDSASAYSHDSFAVTTPSGASFTSHSSFSSINLAVQYFDLKGQQNAARTFADDAVSLVGADETAAAAAAAPKRKTNMASFLLRGSVASSANSHEKRHSDISAFDVSLPASIEEEEVYAFVFDDICLLTHKEQKVVKASSTSIKKKAGGANATTVEETFTLLSHGGISRVLAVNDVSKCIAAHEHLIEVEVMPINKQSAARGGLAGTVSFYFSFGGEQESACNAWRTSFDRAFCGSIITRKTSANADVAKCIQAQAEWSKRQHAVRTKVINAAKACDRVNLAALLQTGLPYPRSPAQQKLADMAVRMAAHVEWHGVKARDLFALAAVRKSTAAAAAATPSAAQTTRPRLRSSNSSASIHNKANAVDVECIARIGDADVMRGIQTWAEERREERMWWNARLTEIQLEAEQEQEIVQMLDVRRARSSQVPAPLLDAPTPLAVPTPLPAVPASCNSPARTVRIRRGLPVLKIGSSNPVLSH